jgi:hypothetical protein
VIFTVHRLILRLCRSVCVKRLSGGGTAVFYAAMPLYLPKNCGLTMELRSFLRGHAALCAEKLCFSDAAALTVWEAGTPLPDHKNTL